MLFVVIPVPPGSNPGGTQYFGDPSGSWMPDQIAKRSVDFESGMTKRKRLISYPGKCNNSKS